MMVESSRRVHANPVYGAYFADPFVWKVRDTWYAIGTGQSEAEGNSVGKIFPILQSADFYQWKFASSALLRPDPRLGANFWAPEIAFENDVYYLYYSVGQGNKNHQIRVATSDSPQGPYRDLGKTLIDREECPFAIDAHPFRDEDGQWYLFYARDFLDKSAGARAGTALMVAKMKSMTELESAGIPVLRARCDWQRFQAERSMYGTLWDWHTLEGPFVRKHEGRYYCFYSGGRWENDSYGVDYGIAEHVTGTYSDAGNETGPRVLHTVRGKIIGPGHNSIVTGPDGETDYLVYHAWDKEMKARQMFIDKLEWTSEGPKCTPTLGATSD